MSSGKRNSVEQWISQNANPGTRRVSLMAEAAAAPGRLTELQAAPDHQALMKRWALAKRVPVATKSQHLLPKKKQEAEDGDDEVERGEGGDGEQEPDSAGPGGSKKNGHVIKKKSSGRQEAIKKTASGASTTSLSRMNSKNKPRKRVLLTSDTVELMDSRTGEWRDVRRYGIVTCSDEFASSSVSDEFANSFGVEKKVGEMAYERGGADRAMLHFRIMGEAEITVKGGVGDSVGDVFLGLDVIRQLRAANYEVMLR